MREWEKYKIGEKSTKSNWVEPSCQPFFSVYHITHISDAFRVMEDGVIRSSLVWDESKLNNTRTCVSWVSPNTWAFGSIYGHVVFEYIWEKLIENKKFYWVEGFSKYKPPAYRILITQNDYSDSNLLTPYSIEDGKGPLYFDGEKWYRNGSFTGEFMIDEDLELKNCHVINFVSHNKKFCSKSGSRCADIKISQHRAAAQLVSFILSNNLEAARNLLINTATQKPTPQTAGALRIIFEKFGNYSPGKTSKLNQAQSKLLTKSCLSALAAADYEYLREITPIIGTKNEISTALEQVVSEYFNIEFNELLD